MLAAFVLVLGAGSSGEPLECTSAEQEPLWPTFHLFNNVSLDSSGRLQMQGLNDANAVLEYKGIFHAFVQGGLGRSGMVGDWSTGGWTHAVSNDSVRWYRVKPALGRGPVNSSWDHDGPCDGTLTPQEGAGSAGPVILYGPDCADRLPKTGGSGSGDGSVVRAGLGDYPRIAVARAVDPSSPYLLDWRKDPSGLPVSFDGPPCSFPGRVWHSDVGPYFNMLCSFGQGKSWARYTASNTSSLLRWKLADQHFTNVVGGGGGALFHAIPNAPANGPTHLINGNTGSEFWLGNYDSRREAMTLTSHAAQRIDFGTVFDWSAAGRATDGRLLLIGKVDANPGAGRSYGSLIRALSFDRKAGQLVSQPMREIQGLRNRTFFERRLLQLPAGQALGPINTLFAGGTEGGALDLLLSFDIEPSSPALGGFGVGVRAPAGTLHGAAMRLDVSVSAADSDGVRTALLQSTAPVVPPPPTHKETLSTWLEGVDLDHWQSVSGAAHFPEDTGPAVCQELCHKNPSCKAWTHERRHQGPGVECRLHTTQASHGAPVLPCPLPNKLCTSGAKAPLAFMCRPNKRTWITGGGDSNFTVRVLQGEPLSLRLIVDRPIIELFAQGGRGALVAADQTFSLHKTSVHLFNSGHHVIRANASLYGMGCGWASSLPLPKPGLRTDDAETTARLPRRANSRRRSHPPPPPTPTNANAPVGWWSFDTARGSAVPDRAGHGNGFMDLTGTKIVNLGVAGQPNASALRIFGNSSSESFSVSSSALNSVEEWSLGFWLDWWWGALTLCSKGDQLGYVQLYDGYLKFEMRTARGKIEATAYPRQCGYIQPGEWQHIVLTYSKSTGTAALFVNGVGCYNASVGKGSLQSSKDPLSFANFSGLIADVRVYKAPLSAAAVAALHSTTAAVYSAAAVKQPSPEEIKHKGLGWVPFPAVPGDESMRNAWLNHAPQPGDSDDLSSLLGARRILWAGEQGRHPTLQTAVVELAAALPHASVVQFRSAGADAAGDVLIGTCSDAPVVRAMSSECPVQGGEEAFVLRVISKRLHIVGGGDAGVLYGAWAAVRHIQLRTAWESGAIDTDESPSTTIRLLNHWSVWRGLPQDAWMPPRTNRSALPFGAFHEGGSSGPYDDGADRTDSVFSWADLTNGPTANSTARIRAWARLLSSVGINSLAPQDVNWFEPSNFMKHLPEVNTLGTILRAYAIRLFWTPNYLLAPQQEVADALWRAVPDFGGYLLKVGSEGQGGIATPENINAIAAVLRRAPGSGQKDGTAVVRGFIYGSEYCEDHDESKTNRMAIPAKFFGKYDGQYDQNVYIMGKYSALDYETTEPINPLDGLMQKTKYGPDVECGKGFPMSWSSRWEEWLGFDTMRGPSGGSLLNRQTTSGILGVCILGTNPSWTDNPLNMVNYYALGRLSWNTSLTTAEIHEEFVRRSFGAALPPAASRSILSVLSDSETAADDLGIYRGYRGVWYKFCEGDHCSGPGLRSKPVNNQVLSKSGAGMPKPLAADLLSHYSAGVRAIYSNHSDPRSEKSLLEWGVFPLTYRLQNGRTLIEDMALRPSEGLATAIAMRDSWRTAEAAVRAAVGDAYYEATDAELQEFVVIATEMVGHLRTALALLHPIPPAPPPTP